MRISRLLLAVALLCAVSYGQVTVSPLVNPHNSFVDQVGAPCAGCALFSYTAGSTIPTPTYQDASGSIPNTNPIILSVQGGANIWVNTFVSYKFVLKNTVGTTIWSVDNVSSPAGGSNGKSIVSNPGGSQTVTQPPGSDFNVNTSGGGKFYYNGNEVLTSASQIPFVAVDNQINAAKTDPASQWIFYAAGDSMTFGHGLPSQDDAWGHKTAVAKGWSSQFLVRAVSGFECADWANLYFQNFPITTYATTSMMLGFNDANNHGNTPGPSGNLDHFRGCMEAVAAYLSIPDTQKIKGQTTTSRTGTWTNLAAYGGALGIQSTVTGSTATYTTPPGTSVYIVSAKQNGTGSSYTITVDGNAVPNAISGDNQFATFSNIITSAGLNYSPYLVRVSGLAYTPHTVVFTANAAGAGVPVYVLFVAAVNNGAATTNGPWLYLANMPRLNAAGYAVSAGGLTDAMESQFDSIYQGIVSDLANDGLQVSLVDIGNYASYDPTATPAQVQSDNIHPNVLGETKIANAFISAMTSALSPGDRAQGTFYKNVTAANGSLFVGPVPGSFLPAPGSLGTSSGLSTGQIYFGFDGNGGITRSANSGSGKVVFNFTAAALGLGRLGFGGIGSGIPAFCFNISSTIRSCENTDAQPSQAYQADHFIADGTVANTFPAGSSEGKFVNSAGRQIVSATGCTISAGAIGNACNTTMNLPVTEPDTNYKVTGCVVTSAAGAPVYVGNIVIASTTQFVASVFSGLAAATGGGTLTCLVTHN